MILTGEQLLDLIKQGVINADPKNVNASSIDVTLSDMIMVEDVLTDKSLVCIAEGESPAFTSIRMGEQGMIIQSGQCFLASTNETFNLPNNISAEFITRSSIGRCFLEHMKSGWIDAGFSGQITLELVNMLQAHEILITPNLRVGQVVFHRHNMVDKEHSYATKGNYNGQKGPTKAFGGKNADVPTS